MSEKNRNPDELITLAGDILTDMTAADLEKPIHRLCVSRGVSI